jgi:hypothetical protein
MVCKILVKLGFKFGQVVGGANYDVLSMLFKLVFS